MSDKCSFRDPKLRPTKDNEYQGDEDPVIQKRKETKQRDSILEDSIK